MGMSGDYDVAIEEGATVVRVGQAIFGARATQDSYYLPGLARSGAQNTVADWPRRAAAFG